MVDGIYVKQDEHIFFTYVSTQDLDRAGKIPNMSNTDPRSYARKITARGHSLPDLRHRQSPKLFG